MNPLQDYLQQMLERGASDLFFKAGGPPCFRIDGTVQMMSDHSSLKPEETLQLAKGIMDERQSAVFEKTHEMDVGLGVKGIGRFRINIFVQRGTVGLVIRHVPKPEFDFEELNLPPAVRDLAQRKRGMVLVTGTTGSGKSTTLAAMINYINSSYSRHILTVEDPIEFIHTDDRSIINQREIGFDTLSFADALRHVLRQSPDVILIGEMRDVDTIQTAIRAAETGHLVLSTLHTTDAVQTVERIIHYFPAYLHEQVRMELSLSLQGVISQRLLPMASGRGRIPATEIMIATSTIRKLIYEGKTLDLRPFIADGSHVGMMTFDQSLISLYRAHQITLEDALAQATSPDEFRLAIDGIGTGVKSSEFTKY